MSGTTAEVSLRIGVDEVDNARRRLEGLSAAGDQAMRNIASGGQAAAWQQRQLAFQLNDVFTQLASGGSVTQTFAQQGGQIYQIYGNVGGVLRGVLAALGGPWGVAFAAAGVAVAALASRSASLTDETRQLSVALRGAGRDASIATDQLQAYIRTLEAGGVARADARSIVQGLGRTQGLSGASIGAIAQVAPGVAAATGSDPAAAAQQLGQALSGGYDGIRKLDDALNFLTADQRAAIRTMLEHGDKTRAMEAAAKALSDRFQGLQKDALSPAAQALRDLSVGWSAFIDEVAKSRPILLALGVLNDAFQGAALIMKGSAPMSAADQADTRATELYLRLEALQKQYDVVSRDQAGSPRRAALPTIESQMGQLREQIAQARAQRDALASAGAAVPNPDAPLRGSPIGEAGPGEDARQRKWVDEQTRGYAELQRVLGVGITQRAAMAAAIKAEREAADAGITGLAREEFIRRRVAEATAQDADARAQETAAIRRETEAQLAATVATDQGRAAALRAQAAAEAHAQAASKAGVSEAGLARAILNRNAAQAAAKGAEVARDLDDQNEALRRLIAAENEGGLAPRWAELENNIRAATRQLEAYREVAADPAVREALDREIAHIRAGMAAQEGLARSLREQRTSLEALADIGGNAFSRLGDAAAQFFFSAERGAVNFGSVFRSVLASSAADLAKLSLINPARNFFFPGLSAAPTLSSALGGGGISDLLGISSLIPKDGVLSSLGLGSGSLSGLGSSIFGSAGYISPIGEVGVAGSSGLFGMGGTSFLGGPLTMSGAFTGIGGGFGAGMLVNSLLGGNQLGGGIGSGLGALGGFLVGGPIGGLIGGALGGGLGGLFGPRESVRGYGLRLTGAGTSGIDPIDYTYYNDSGKAVFQEAEQLRATLNAYVQARGLTVGGSSIIGGNKNGPDYSSADSGSVSEAFSRLYFGANDNQLNAALQRKGEHFGSVDELQQFVESFTQVQAVISDLTDTADQKLAKSLDAINKQFDDLSAKAREYGLSEAGLAEARQRALDGARSNAAGQSLLADLAFGSGSALAPEQRYFAALTTLNQARAGIANGGGIDAFAAAARQVLPVAKDYLGTSQRYAALVSDVSGVLAGSGGNAATLAAILQASAGGSDAMIDTFARYGDASLDVANATLREITLLRSAMEAFISRIKAA